MENWFEDIGKTVLLEALGDACGRINNSFRTDFQAYARDGLNLTAELENLRHKASQVRHIQDENAALKAEIKTLKDASRGQAHAPATTSRREAEPTLPTPAASSLTNRSGSKSVGQIDIDGMALPELKDEFLRLTTKYTKLHGKYLDLQDALLKSKEALQKRTATYHQWVDHTKKLSEQSLRRARRIKKLEAKLAEISQDPLNLSFASDAGGLEVAAEPAYPDRHHREQSNLPLESLDDVPQCQPKVSPHVYKTRKLKSPSISRSTIESNSSDLPFEMGYPQGSDEIEPCMPPLPQDRDALDNKLHIKSEPSSDTPTVLSERSLRKRKTADRERSNVPVFTTIKSEHSSGVQAPDERRHSTPHESIDFDTEYRRVKTPRKHTRYQYAQSVHDDDDLSVLRHDHITNIVHPVNQIKHKNHQPANNVSARDLAAGRLTEPQANISSVLQSLDNNQVLKPRSKMASGSRNQKSAAMARGLAGLAEDSYQDENVNPSKSKKGPKNTVLEKLLNTPSPAQADRSRQSEDFGLQLPKRREPAFGEEEAPSFIYQGNGVGAMMDKVERVGSEAVPLRQTPMTMLRLDDFKINPHANEGYSYAFTDVVRKKDSRACLQGCIKESCCGHKFRALAHAFRAATRPYEFQSLLESYLGDDCYKLSAMSEGEKEKLWVKAKIRELANSNGKHRHRYPRMSTPPGFWRADFPSTQEGEEYNEEAAELEHKIVEERYREAMRPGGLWVFRDE
ncbi:DNA repair protein endonuclease SAE2/CtIP C-terminus-domain-containing protein [Xylaria palmicola]|nr:DNA repair protein endonuclease SAE2/CtIP C-terminus-domain-containing protein [Xylaria palmicola]